MVLTQFPNCDNGKFVFVSNVANPFACPLLLIKLSIAECEFDPIFESVVWSICWFFQPEEVYIKPWFVVKVVVVITVSLNDDKGTTTLLFDVVILFTLKQTLVGISEVFKTPETKSAF